MTAIILPLPRVARFGSAGGGLLLALSAGAVGLCAQITGTTYLEPKIKQQPVGQVVGIGETATFKVVMETEPDPTPIANQYRYYDSTFQWIKDGVRIEGATTATLTIKNARPADAGVYFLAINWSRERTTSSAVALAVVASAPPAIAVQPTGGTFQREQSVTLRVIASGAPAPQFQWYRDSREITGSTADSLTFSHIQTADAGNYEVRVTNPFGTLQSRSAAVTVADTAPAANPGAPAFVAEPQGAVVRPGDPVELSAAAAGAGVTYQWFRDGVALPDATAPVLSFPAVTAADSGCYTVRAANAAGTAASQSAALAVTGAETGRLTRLTARGYVPRGEALTVGFSLRDPGPTALLLRAAGPALAATGGKNFLLDPHLALRAAGAAETLAANDNWDEGPDRENIAAATAATGAAPFAAGARDAALYVPLGTTTDRAYTLQVTSSESTAEGVVQAEVHDPAGAGDPGRLAGVSLLATVGADERGLTAGFTIGGAPKRLLIRAVGPGLAALGVGGAMADPEISVTPDRCPTPVARNTDWANSPEIGTAAATAGAFPLAPESRDAAVVVTLPPGDYTIALTGAGGSTGLVLLEIYDLDR